MTPLEKYKVEFARDELLRVEKNLNKTLRKIFPTGRPVKWDHRNGGGIHEGVVLDYPNGHMMRVLNSRTGALHIIGAFEILEATKKYRKL
ncbi:hypothetical protein ACVQH5_29510 [Klebsiella pneumoniae]